MRHWVKIVAVMMAVVMSMLSAPTFWQEVAQAEWDVGTTEELQPVQIGQESEQEEPKILFEDHNKRELNQKHYYRADGTYLAQLYSEPIHYKENGKFFEIDNSLQEATVNGEKVYRNLENSFQAEFASGSGAETLLSVKKDEAELSFRLAGRQGNSLQSVALPAGEGMTAWAGPATVSAQIENHAAAVQAQENTAQIAATQVQTAEAFQTTVGEISYSGIFDQTDFVYEVKGNQVKENIVIKQKQNVYRYLFEIETKNLSLIQEGDEILAYDQSQNAVFKIPAAYMFDAQGNRSEEVGYQLTESQGKYFLMIEGSAEWINAAGRAFPVTIDPIVEEVQNQVFTWKNITQQGEFVATDARQQAYVGRIKHNNILSYSRLYLQFYLLSKVWACQEILSMDIFWETGQRTFFGGSMNYNIEIAPNVALSALTWSNKPQNLKNIFTAQIGFMYKDCTTIKPVEPQYIRDDMLTFCFKMTDENRDGEEYARIYLEDYGPRLDIVYKPSMGLENSYTVESQPYDHFTGYVNVLTRRLTAEIPLLSVHHNLMPVDVSLVYNGGFEELREDLGLASSSYGLDFKLNLEQYLIYDSAGDYHVYVDADGTPHVFVLLSSGLYYNAARDLYLNQMADNGTTYWTIFDADGNKLIFDNGKLKKIRSLYGRELQLTWSGNQVKSATNGDQTANLNYIGGKLTSLNSNYGDWTYLTYDGIFLTDVYKQQPGYSQMTTLAEMTYGAISPFGTTEMLLSRIEDGTGSGVSYSYFNDPTSVGSTDRAQVISCTDIKTTAKTSFESLGTLFKAVIREDGSNEYFTQYIFDGAGICAAQNSGLMEKPTANSQKQIINYREDSVRQVGSNDVRTSVTYQIEQDLSSVPNGSFEDNVGGLLNWIYTEGGTLTTTTDYLNDNDKVLLLQKGKTLRQSNFFFAAQPGREYALCFQIDGRCSDCCVRVRLDRDYSIFTNKVLQIPDRRLVVIPLGTLVTSSGYKLYFENVCPQCSAAQRLNNVSISPILSKTETVTNMLAGSEVVHSASQVVTTEGQVVTQTYANKNGNTPASAANYTASNLPWTQLSQTITVNKADQSEKKETFTYNYQNRTLTSVSTSVKLGNVTSSRGTLTYTYNSDGQILKKESIAPNLRQIENYTYGNYGYPATYVDANGQTTSWTYGLLGNNWNLKNVTANGMTQTYGYNVLGDVISVTGGGMSQTYHYAGDEFQGITFGGRTFLFEYTAKDYLSDITQNNVSLISYTYDSFDRLSGKTYANGDTVSYAYNSYDALTSETYSGGTVYSYQYDSTKPYLNTGATVTAGNTVRLTYGYDFDEAGTYDELSVTPSGGTSATYRTEYRVDGLPEEEQIQYGTLSPFGTLTHEYDKYQQLTETSGSGVTSAYGYNMLDQLTAYELKNSSGTAVINQSYQYFSRTEGGKSYATNRIWKQTSKRGTQVLTYSGNNITQSSDSGSTVTFGYDSANRLSSHGRSGVTESYTYDANNNLTKVTSSGAGSGWADEYTYSGGLLLKMTRAGSAVMPGKNYWFTYDEMGNPERYKTASQTSAVNMTWSQGRYLSSYLYGGSTVSYRYDQNGIRYSKTVNGTETVYYLDGSRIMAEKTGDAIKYYYYDGTGIAAVREGNNFYYVEKNLFGDVVRVYDSAGTVVASYSYDAWGYPLETSGSKADLVPFRYRGYYYDAESGFYYLNSRYDDPEIRRFVNSDNVEILAELSQNLGELNLYSYCNNNPVMYSDPSGEGIFLLIAILVAGAIIGGTVGGVIAYNNGARGWDLALGILSGAAMGLAAAGLGIAAGTALYVGGAALFTGKTVTTAFWGVAVKQAFAIGALAYNGVGFFIAPLLNIEMEAIELGESSDMPQNDNGPGIYYII